MAQPISAFKVSVLALLVGCVSSEEGDPLAEGGPLAASSGTCLKEQVRYATTSNRIYLENGAVCTLTQIKAVASASAQLTLVNSARGIWWLGSNIIVEDGSRLKLWGRSSGGDVETLRMKSDNDSSAGFVQIFAYGGNVDVRDTTIVSWDSDEAGPDTNYSNGRAFIRAVSFLDGSTARESTLDITRSEIAYLGYNAAESYGLSWKVRGSTRGIYDLVEVYGDVTDSEIHHNYYGAYTFGAYGMEWSDNEIHSNVGYGLDPHDDSDRLVIERNHFHDNGNHGFIASKRCDGLTIRDNVSEGNAANGFMLHRASDESVLRDNEAYDNVDSGFAIFDSHDNVLMDNIAMRNDKGIRFTVGSSGNVVTGGSYTSNATYGVYMTKGSDAPTINDGRPSSNTFAGATISENGQYGVKMGYADASVFDGNTLCDNPKGVYVTAGDPTGNVFTNNTFCSATSYGIKVRDTEDGEISGNTFDTQERAIVVERSEGVTIASNTIQNSTLDPILLDGSEGLLLSGNDVTENTSAWIALESADATFVDADELTLLQDTSSRATLTDASFRAYAAEGATVSNTIDASGTEATWRGTSGSVPATLRAVPLYTTMPRGSVTFTVSAWEAGRRAWAVSDASSSAASFRVQDVSPGSSWVLTMNGVASTLTADGSGQLTFTPPELEGVRFELTPE